MLVIFEFPEGFMSTQQAKVLISQSPMIAFATQWRVFHDRMLDEDEFTVKESESQPEPMLNGRPIVCSICGGKMPDNHEPTCPRIMKL